MLCSYRSVSVGMCVQVHVYVMWDRNCRLSSVDMTMFLVSAVHSCVSVLSLFHIHCIQRISSTCLSLHTAYFKYVSLLDLLSRSIFQFSCIPLYYLYSLPVLRTCHRIFVDNVCPLCTVFLCAVWHYSFAVSPGKTTSHYQILCHSAFVKIF